jgi:hypothetical protein
MLKEENEEERHYHKKKKKNLQERGFPVTFLIKYY